MAENIRKEDEPILAENVSCPECNSAVVAYMRYGSSKSWTKFDGGCTVTADKPKYICQDCEHRFGELGPSCDTRPIP